MKIRNFLCNFKVSFFIWTKRSLSVPQVKVSSNLNLTKVRPLFTLSQLPTIYRIQVNFVWTFYLHITMILINQIMCFKEVQCFEFLFVSRLLKPTSSWMKVTIRLDSININKLVLVKKMFRIYKVKELKKSLTK